MKTYIGVDLGGTNVRVAKVDETGAILQIVKEPTEIGKGVEQVVSKIISMIERIEDMKQLPVSEWGYRDLWIRKTVR